MTSSACTYETHKSTNSHYTPSSVSNNAVNTCSKNTTSAVPPENVTKPTSSVPNPHTYSIGDKSQTT